jgi:DNA-binding response OmpR family regulator
MSTQSAILYGITARNRLFEYIAGKENQERGFVELTHGSMELANMYKDELKFCKSGNPSDNTNYRTYKKNLVFSPFRFDLSRRKVYKHDQPITLTSIEYRLALFFFQHQRVLITREQLLEQVWQTSTAIRTRTIDVHISTLRKKLSLDTTQWSINTVYGAGYRLIYSEHPPDLAEVVDVEA